MPGSKSCVCSRVARCLGIVAVLVVAVLVVAVPALDPGAAQAQSREERLSEALQRARSQVSTLEQEAARLRVELADLEEAKEAELQALREETTQQVEGVQARFAAAQQQFQERLEQEREFRNRLLDNIEKWKAAYGEVAELAQEKEEERLNLTAELADANERNALCTAKNQELFAVGNDILDRLANIGVGDVLAIREPFIGVKRVELQNIVQDYQDELLDNQVTTPR